MENKIMLGDSYKLIKELPDKSVDLIYTDVPYLIENHGYGHSELSNRLLKQSCDLGDADGVKILKKKIAYYREKMDNATDKAEYEKYHCRHSNLLNKLNLLTDQDITKGFDYAILDEFVRVMKHIYIYIWCSKEQIFPIMEFFVKKGCYYNILVWCKDNPIPFGSSHFLSDIEYCLVFYEKGCEFNNGWEHKRKWFSSHINSDDKKKYNHPTIKPIEMVKNHILNSTNENDIVLDPFMGSGTTCVACKELNRKYIGFEINEKYYNIAKDRLNGINQKGQMSLLDTDFEQLDLFGDNNNE